MNPDKNWLVSYSAAYDAVVGAYLEAVNVGKIKSDRVLPDRRTAIDKRAIDEPVAVTRTGLALDEIADLVHHGGSEQAVYAFAREDYRHWEEQLGRSFRSGSFGENLTTVGLDVQNSKIGDRWQVGTALLEVTDVRIPCATFARHINEPRWVKRFTEHGVPGAYLRVIETGQVASGDPVLVVESRDHDLTVGRLFRARTTNRSDLASFAVEPRVAAGLLAKIT